MHIKNIFLSLSMIVSTQAFASAPMQTTGNPGYYRFKLGEFEINTINDGTAELPMGTFLTNASKKDIQAAIKKNFLEDTIETSVDAFLINTGTKLVLVDTGSGGGFGKTGELQEHLKAAGYKPEQVDFILITHLHGDHIGGLSKDGNRLFPNAELYIGKEDVDYYTDAKNGEKLTGDMKAMFAGVAPKIAPYMKSGHFKPITGDMDITIGVHARATHGHTPGHTIYEITSGGKKLMLLGDLIHVASVQFENPSVCIPFDTDQKAAEKQRKTIFAEAAKNGSMIGAAHLPFPGVGHLRAQGKGYTFIPVNYTR